MSSRTAPERVPTKPIFIATKYMLFRGQDAGRLLDDRDGNAVLRRLWKQQLSSESSQQSARFADSIDTDILSYPL